VALVPDDPDATGDSEADDPPIAFTVPFPEPSETSSFASVPTMVWL
jgi:hypothetical protein